MPEVDAIRAQLFALQDQEYQVFYSRLMPTLPPETVIGVRVPLLRRLAKQLANIPEAETFLQKLPHFYYEENALHAFLLESVRDFGAALAATEHFLPYVDNWAVCDSFSPKVFAQHKPELHTTNLLMQPLSISFENAALQILRFSKIHENTHAWVIPLHTHPTIELHYILSGAGQIQIDDTLFHVEANDIYVTLPFVPHCQISSAADIMEEYCVECTLELPPAVKGETDPLASLRRFLSRQAFSSARAPDELLPLLTDLLFDELLRLGVKVLAGREEPPAGRYILVGLLLKLLPLDDLPISWLTVVRELLRFVVPLPVPLLGVVPL